MKKFTVIQGRQVSQKIDRDDLKKFAKELRALVKNRKDPVRAVKSVINDAIKSWKRVASK
jgi:hypothetical protein